MLCLHYNLLHFPPRGQKINKCRFQNLFMIIEELRPLNSCTTISLMPFFMDVAIAG